MVSEQEWVKERQLFAGVAPSADQAAAEPWTGPLAHEFAKVAHLLLDSPTVAGVLDRVVGAVKALVPEADFVSITLRTKEGRYTTPVRTDELADRLDELQYTFDEGPCVHATRTSGEGIVDVPDVSAGPWPRWASEAAALGVGSVFAVGLVPADDPPRLGALNLYSRQSHALDKVDRDLSIVLASHATVALAATTAMTSAEFEHAQLRAALESRDVIGQAKGILMQRRGLSAEGAFDLLRRTSQDLNIKLAKVAELFVNSRHDI
ncbi:ANTAR domain-containing protein [Prauserella cavernicola]|uniref:ANTAR domain-containing protein n=1 Tax=Prauserella cavernicola TaxID=2800127 RepID=A0A934QYR4_9PSEU|nr:ANTAR domain-containing protein [Prauserella cavernicola]MBK1787754.1 ANTAR domain-containing protein [Prauserella cavernicola]